MGQLCLNSLLRCQCGPAGSQVAAATFQPQLTLETGEGLQPGVPTSPSLVVLVYQVFPVSDPPPGGDQ